ncbi:MAG: CcmD family protein [Chloroflexi bacterium]|nr:CcmD family protein [Chloroflexota bacterium]
MHKRTTVALAMTLLAAILIPQTVLASVVGQEGETVRNANLPYLFAAFAVVWAGFFGYLFYIHQRNSNLRQEIDELKEELEEQQKR